MANKVNFVKKSENPPNVPECRPIENFWRNWQAKNLDQLKVRIRLCLKKIDLELVKRMAASTRLLVGRIRKNGVIEEN